MIPKIIHYVWVGGKPLTSLAKKCIKSWKKFCPDYKIIQWNESNFDIKQNQYCREAYENKKWAFVSDYIRVKVLKEYGGIYMDTDVEVKKPLDSFLYNKAFSGYENDNQIPTGIMGSIKDGIWITELLKDYDDKKFVNKDGSLNLETNVKQITRTTLRMFPEIKLNNTYTNCKEVVFYPKDYFCPIDYATLKKRCTENTTTIHWFAGSWVSPKIKRRRIIKKFLNIISFGLFNKILILRRKRLDKHKNEKNDKS